MQFKIKQFECKTDYRLGLDYDLLYSYLKNKYNFKILKRDTQTFGNIILSNYIINLTNKGWKVHNPKLKEVIYFNKQAFDINLEKAINYVLDKVALMSNPV